MRGAGETNSACARLTSYPVVFQRCEHEIAGFRTVFDVIRALATAISVQRLIQCLAAKTSSSRRNRRDRSRARLRIRMLY
jgi:hypothetical protein